MKSDYKIYVTTPFIIIYDLNLGGKSVTNDIENIIKKLKERFNLNLDGFSAPGNGMQVIYRDSDGDYARVVKNIEGNIAFDLNAMESFDKLGKMYLESVYNNEIDIADE